MKRTLSGLMALLMLLCLMSGALVIVCSMAAQIINEQIDPRVKAQDRIPEVTER